MLVKLFPIPACIKMTWVKAVFVVLLCRRKSFWKINKQILFIMASVKVKFRASTVEGRPGCIYFQVIQNRMARQIHTDYMVHADEWDSEAATVVVGEGERRNVLEDIKERLEWDVARMTKVIQTLENECRRFSADDVVAAFQKVTRESSLCGFMHGIIAQLKRLGRVRTSETYHVTLRSFMAFREGEDMPLDGITSDLMLLYEAWLKARDVRMNTISFYMRILRAVYNRAVEKRLAPQRNPFRHVYTGIDKTVKRAVPIKVVRALKGMDLSLKPSLEYARDLFLISFYTRGMSFVDMAYLRKTDLKHGVLTYRRRKTGQQLTIRWERCMEDIVERYKVDGSEYLLPIINRQDDERRQYTNALHLVNSRLKKLSVMLGLQRPLTMYVARHSWASAAKAKNVPIAVISEGMGHDSEATTQVYLASLETSVVDKANKMILSLL